MSLIGPEGIRNFNGVIARKLIFQERAKFKDLQEGELDYIWSVRALHEDLDLSADHQRAVIGSEIQKLMSETPSRMSLTGFKEEFASCVSFLAARSLVRFYEKFNFACLRS